MIWLNQGEQNGTQASLGCDSTSDLANLPAFAEEHHLRVGSSCLCQSDFSIHMMNSDGSWT